MAAGAVVLVVILCSVAILYETMHKIQEKTHEDLEADTTENDNMMDQTEASEIRSDQQMTIKESKNFKKWSNQ